MTRTGSGRPRLAAATLVALLAGLVIVPLTATPAAAVVVTCAGLQDALTDAPDGGTVTLTEGEVCFGSFFMPTLRSITFEGGGSGATLDGSENEDARILRAHDVRSSTIRNLTFRNGTYSSNGAAIKIQGDSQPTVEGNRFIGNESTNNGGGAVSVRPIDGVGPVTFRNNVFGGTGDGEGNVAVRGGGLYIESYATVVLENNQFLGNRADVYGGGASVQLNQGADLLATGNTFSENVVVVPPCAQSIGFGGGGLAVFGSVESEPPEGDDGFSHSTQRDNRFTDNEVELEQAFCQQAVALEAAAAEEDYGELYGGGEHVIGADVDSVDDRFISNTVDNTLDVPEFNGALDGEGEAEGGGLSLLSSGSRRLSLEAENLVAAGNDVIGEGNGGGIYVGGDLGVDVELIHATVSANHADETAGGIGGGVIDTSDHLVLANSIVWGNTADGEGAEPDIDGFGTVTANFSDVCVDGLEPGSGNNLCADPKLVAPVTGDVHQTSTSPTLDVASNALTPSTLTTDYEGDARIQDANGDGPAPAVADMGADELNAPPPPTPPAVAADNVTAPGSIGEDDGYCLGAEDGGVFTFGGCQFFGAAGGPSGRVRLAADGVITAPQSLVKLNAPVVGIAMQPSDTGYWQAAADGGVFSFGTAGFHGSMGGTPLSKPIVGVATSPTGNGYWLVASDGGVFGFGDAPFLGSLGNIQLAKPIVGITVTPSGKGYWLVASDGGVFSFGDAQFFGSAAGMKLNAPIVGIGPRPGGLGYWLAASDGGVFTFGDAPFLGSRVGLPLNQPVIGIKSTASGNGYWLIAGDGGVFSFGSAPFLGSMGLTKLNQPVIDMTG